MGQEHEIRNNSIKLKLINAVVRLVQLSKPVVLINGISLLVLFGAIDVITGNEISLSLLYIVPIAWVSWRCGFPMGTAMAFSGAVVWFLADSVLVHHPYSSYWIPYWNATIRLGIFMVVIVVLEELKKALIREREFARRDFYTGIANSQAFYEYARMEIDRSRRYNHPLAVAYMDCDNFKSINDSFGHHVGDQLLRIVGQTIQKLIRKSDFAARLGGDEFAVLLPETGADAAYEVVQKLRERLLATMGENRWSITFSFGLVTFINPPDTVDEMIQVADAYMYSAKNSGKNKINQNVFTRQRPRHSLLEVLVEQSNK